MKIRTCIHVSAGLSIIIFNDNSFSDCGVLSCGQTGWGVSLQTLELFVTFVHNTTSTVQYATVQGRNQRDTAVYMTGRLTEDFRFPSFLDNALQFPLRVHETTPTKNEVQGQ